MELSLGWISMKIKNDITILYVEDEENIRTMLSRFILRFCKEIYIAKNGAEGLELYKEFQPDIVISDIKMPVMNGLEMVKAIKKINSEQVVLYTTAHNESGFLLESIEMQVDGYVLKPIDLDIFGIKIQKYIEQIEMKKNYRAHIEILKEVAYLQNDLLLVLDKNYHTIFANNKTLDFFAVKNYEDIVFSSSLFVKHSDFYVPKDGVASCIEELLILQDDKRVVAIEDAKTHEPKAFLITLKRTEDSLHTIIALSEVTNMKINYKKSQIKAYTDELTKIANRAKFNEELQKEIDISKMHGFELSLVVMDIDYFKKFNDTYGHKVGDMILVELASLIVKNTRQSDTFARWGGEEFVYLLPNANIAGAQKVANNLREDIESHDFADGHSVTCSFGCAQLQEGDTMDSFFTRADKALYEAKSSGRNRVV